MTREVCLETGVPTARMRVAEENVSSVDNLQDLHVSYEEEETVNAD